MNNCFCYVPENESEGVILGWDESLSINGVTSNFPCRKPTCAEFEDGGVPRIVLTAGAPYWDTLDRYFAQHEVKMTDFRGLLVEEAAMERGPKMVISEVLPSTAGIDVLSNENFGLMLESNVNVSNKFTTVAMTNLETHNIMRMGTPSSRSSSEINHEIAQARWGIHPTLANNTVECTTQKVFRISCPHPLLTKRIRKNNRILCYNRLPCNVFADTLILGTVSKGGNKYAELFATDFSWAQAYPIV